jgi:hypothetical protein
MTKKPSASSPEPGERKTAATENANEKEEMAEPPVEDILTLFKQATTALVAAPTPLKLACFVGPEERGQMVGYFWDILKGVSPFLGHFKSTTLIF